MNISKVIRAGNSVAIIIPRAVASALEINRGDYCAIAAYTEHEFYARKLSEAEVLQYKPKIIQHGQDPA